MKNIKNLLCKIGLHRYKERFIEFDDQFLDNDVYGENLTIEGYHENYCERCQKLKES